jgi:hypothetical protein
MNYFGISLVSNSHRASVRAGIEGYITPAHAQGRTAFARRPQRLSSLESNPVGCGGYANRNTELSG